MNIIFDKSQSRPFAKKTNETTINIETISQQFQSKSKYVLKKQSKSQM